MMRDRLQSCDTRGDRDLCTLDSKSSAELLIAIDGQLLHLEDEECSLRGRVRALEDAAYDLHASVQGVIDRACVGEDMGLDASDIDEIHRLRATLLADYDEQRELSHERLRAIDRKRDALYDQRRLLHLQGHR